MYNFSLVIEPSGGARQANGSEGLVICFPTNPQHAFAPRLPYNADDERRTTTSKTMVEILDS